MLVLNRRMVQVWRETEYGEVYLLNHAFRDDDEFFRRGFKQFYQEIRPDQLEWIEALDRSTSEEENGELLRRIGDHLVSKLTRYGYLAPPDEIERQPNSWNSQAGTHLHEFLRASKGRAHPERPPRILLLPTLQCFAKCAYCITDSPNRKNENDLDDDYWEAIAERVARELQPASVDLIGGEPLIRFEAVIRMARVFANHRTLIKLVTNGVLLKEREKLARLAVELRRTNHNVQISVDGHREVHERLRPGCGFDHIMMGVRNLQAEGIAFGFNVTVNTNNLHEIPSLIDYLADYAPRYIIIGPLQISPRDIELCRDILINGDQETWLREVLVEKKARHPGVFMKYDKPERVFDSGVTPLGAGAKTHECTAFQQEMSIGPAGNLISCLRGTGLKEFWGENMLQYDGDWRDLWKGSELAGKFRNIPLRGACNSCGFNQQCDQGCPLETYVLEGRTTGPAVFDRLGGYDPHCDHRVMLETSASIAS